MKVIHHSPLVAIRTGLTGALLTAMLIALPIRAQDQPNPHAGHNMEVSPDVSDPAAANSAVIGMEGMDMPSMRGEASPAGARDPHAYAGGQDFGPYELKLADTHNFASLLAENFEATRADGNTGAAYDLQGWYGGLYNRGVFKAEGDVDEDGRVEEARTELLWGHAIRPYWDLQGGVRYDNGEGPDRSWLAVGMQGLAPYWFELDTTAYIGSGGRTALRFDLSYDLLLTQKLILQPNIEADVYGKSDPERGLGSGLAEIDSQLRLRYEIRREFAPYIGVRWVRQFGETRDLTRLAGGDSSEMHFVAGFRFWF